MIVQLCSDDEKKLFCKRKNGKKESLTTRRLQGSKKETE